MRPGEPSEEVLKRVRTAGVFLRRGDVEAARAEVEDAIRQHGETSELLELHGDVLCERGDRENAALAYHRAYQINPDAASAETKYARLVLAMQSEADQAAMAREMLEGEAARDVKPGNASLRVLHLPSGLGSGSGTTANRPKLLSWPDSRTGRADSAGHRGPAADIRSPVCGFTLGSSASSIHAE